MFKVSSCHDKKMKQSARKEENGASRRQTVDSLSCRSALLLSVVCCIALIHLELRKQEHHRLISSSVTYCGQVEKHILQKMQQNNKDWQMTKGSHLGGQRQQTTGRFVKDINDQVMFDPNGAVMPQFFLTNVSNVSCNVNNLSNYKIQPKIFHGEKAIFSGQFHIFTFSFVNFILIFLLFFKARKSSTQDKSVHRLLNHNRNPLKQPPM